MTTFRIGMAVTGFWVCVWGLVIVCTDYTWPGELNTFGDFLAGVFAPVAISWIVLGYYQQSREIARQAEVQSELAELQRDLKNIQVETKEQAAEQARAAAMTESHVRRDVFFRTYELTKAHLTVLSEEILSRVLERDELNDLWRKYESGADSIFFRRLYKFYREQKNPRRDSLSIRFGEAGVSKAILMNFQKNFQIIEDELKKTRGLRRHQKSYL